MSKKVNKALLYMESINNGQLVQLSNCMVIQDYEYNFEKSRKRNGELHEGDNLGSVMNISVLVGSQNSLKVFYSRAKMFSSSLFSIIFHPVLDDHNVIQSYANAMIIDGTVISIDEYYDSEGKSDDMQMTLKVGILVSGISYLSGNGYNISYNF